MANVNYIATIQDYQNININKCITTCANLGNIRKKCKPKHFSTANFKTAKCSL